jgi:hypothetical protein
MDVNYRPALLLQLILIFLSSNFIIQAQSTILLWENDKAIGVQYTPKQKLDSISSEDYHIFFEELETPILAKVNIGKDIITFRPFVPFTKGKKYKISGKEEEIVFVVPKPENSTTKVSSFFPQSKTLPLNVLKIRLEFSSPMSQNHSHQYVKVFRNGSEIAEYPFLKLENELWNNDQTELTLWFDPGKIKRGLLSRKSKGANFSLGDEIEIQIQNSWPDIDGNRLDQEYSYQFTIADTDKLRPDPEQWDVFAPAAGTMDPLAILIKEELDSKLLTEGIEIYDGVNNVSGEFVIKKKGFALFFYPAEPWKKSNYEIIVNPKLEDLAGNNLIRLFDNDLHKKHQGKTILKKISFQTLPN